MGPLSFLFWCQDKQNKRIKKLGWLSPWKHHARNPRKKNNPCCRLHPWNAWTERALWFFETHAPPSLQSSIANSSSASQILCASFNQENSCFAIGTKNGYKLFDARSGRLRYEKAIGAFSIVEMLFSTSLIATVGAGEQPSLSPRRLCLFNFAEDGSGGGLNFLTTILAICLNRRRLIVVLQEKTYIYEVNSLTILDTIDTVPNSKGLCAFSSNSEACYLALPASTTKGYVLVYNTLEIQSLCQIDAYRSPLAVVEFSSNGMYLATASEQGTIIRVHLVSQATKIFLWPQAYQYLCMYSFLGLLLSKETEDQTNCLDQ